MLEAPAYMTLEQADTIISRLCHSQIELPLSDLVFSSCHADGKTRVHVASKRTGDLSFTPPAVRSIMRLAGVPPGVVREYGEDADFLGEIFEFSLRKRASLPVRLTIVDDHVAGADEGGDTYLSLDDAWLTLLDLTGIAGIESVMEVGPGVRIRAISDHKSSPPRREQDASHAGIQLTLNGSTTVAPFVYRLACRNGMLSCHELYRVDVAGTVGNDLGARLRSTMQDALKAAGDALRRFVQSDEEKIAEPANMLHSLMQELNVPAAHQQRINGLLPELPTEPSAYDVVNLVTGYAQQLRSPQQRERFERLGGATLELCLDTHHHCSHCNQPLLVG